MERDLNDIWDYIAQESAEAADGMTAKLFEAFETLARNPGMGHKRTDLTHLTILFWPVENYLVVYRAKRALIQIVAVVHGKRDIPTFVRQRAAT